MSPSSSSQPLVSIIMPTWNRAGLIRESIQSVVDQSYHHWELIVMDDGSTDHTHEVIASFKEVRIRYQYQEHTGQIASLRTVGLGAARGSLIAFHDSDDLWLPEKLAIQLGHLTRHPKAEYIITNGYHFGEQVDDPAHLESFCKGDLFLPMLLEERFIYFVPSLLFKKEALARIKHGPTTDLAFFLDLASSSPGIFTNERLVKIRKHTGNDSGINPEKAFFDFLHMLDTLLSDQKITSLQHRLLRIRTFYRLSLLYIHQRSWAQALDTLKQLTALDPFHIRSRMRQGQAFWESWRDIPKSPSV